jgi:hypothetical protein
MVARLRGLRAGCWAVGLSLQVAACGDDGGTGPGDEDTTRPTVTSTTPPGGATNVSVSSVITAVFSEAMDIASINSASFTVSGITGTVSASGSTATFTPTTSLSSSTTYTATIAASASDVAGNTLAAAHTWSFTTAAPSVPVADMPLTTGRTWVYQEQWSRAVVGSTIGVDSTRFDGTLVLHVEGPASWQSRSASRLVRYDIETVPGEEPFRATVLYVFQSAAGLETWVPTGGGGEWRRILSRSQLSFSTNHFLLAGDPRGQTTVLSSSSTTVPAGSYSTVLARVQFTQTGNNVPEDIFEDRSEHYANGVGMVRGTWSFDFDDNDPAAFDVYEDGTIQLSQVDAGTYGDVTAEAEANNVGTSVGAQAIPRAGIVAARIAIGDAGTVVTHADVTANILGSKLLQDWYRFTMPSTGAFRIDLVYQTFTGAQPNDVDVFLFREDVGGQLTYVSRSVEAEIDPEAIVVPSLAAGNYYIAVQAWNTPGGAIDYWFVTR